MKKRLSHTSLAAAAVLFASGSNISGARVAVVDERGPVHEPVTIKQRSQNREAARRRKQAAKIAAKRCDPRAED